MEKSTKKKLVAAAVSGLVAAGLTLAKATPAFADHTPEHKADAKDGCNGKDGCEGKKKDGCKAEGCHGKKGKHKAKGHDKKKAKDAAKTTEGEEGAKSE